MTPELLAALRAELQPDEGDKLFVYDDETGKPIVKGSVVIGNPTIAIGRNLAARGMSAAEVDIFFLNDMTKCESDLMAKLPWIAVLSDARKVVVYSLYFNTSLGNIQYFLNEWPHFLTQMGSGQYAIAGQNLRTSEPWATEVGSRAERLATMVENG